MPALMDDWVSELQRVGFYRGDPTTLVGDMDGFPTAICFVSADPPLLLTQIRHGLSSHQIEQQPGSAPSDWQDQHPGTELSLDDRAAWLTVSSPEILQDLNRFSDVTDELLTWLRDRGGRSNPDRCEECGITGCEQVRYVEGRALRICDRCLQQKRDAARLPVSPFGLALVFALGAIGCLLSAIAWHAVWLGHDWLMWKLVQGRRMVIIIPRLLELGIIILLSFVAAAPIAYLIRLVPRRGSIAGGVAGVFALLAIAAGEGLAVLEVASLTHGRLSFSSACWIYAGLLGVSGGVYRSVAALMAVVIACEIAKLPRRPMVS